MFSLGHFFFFFLSFKVFWKIGKLWQHTARAPSCGKGREAQWLPRLWTVCTLWSLLFLNVEAEFFLPFIMCLTSKNIWVWGPRPSSSSLNFNLTTVNDQSRIHLESSGWCKCFPSVGTSVIVELLPTGSSSTHQSKYRSRLFPLLWRLLPDLRTRTICV